MKLQMRDVLLGVYGLGWAAAVGVSLLKTGEVPASLFAALGLGVGAIIGAFRVEGIGTPGPPTQRNVDPPEPSQDQP